MPVSQGSAGGLSGMSLKAWAYVTAAGGLVRGFNVASVAKGAVGAYTISFTAAMSTTEYIVRCTPSGFASPGLIGNINTRAVGSCTVKTGYLIGAGGVGDADLSALWEFYE